MIRFKSTERLPNHIGPDTFYGGKSSAIVIGLWTHGKFPEVRQVLHIDYGECSVPEDGWMDVDESGACDRCTSHGGHAPTHWMPLVIPNKDTP